MLTDFRKTPTVIPEFIGGVKVDRVTQFKYLGTVLDSKLNFNKNTYFNCYAQKMSAKNILLSNVDDNSHVLAKYYELLPSCR